MEDDGPCEFTAESSRCLFPDDVVIFDDVARTWFASTARDETAGRPTVVVRGSQGKFRHQKSCKSIAAFLANSVSKLPAKSFAAEVDGGIVAGR